MFRNEWYLEIENAFLTKFGLQKEQISGWQWTAGRSAIKRMFLQDLTIKEIIDAMDEAHNKRNWQLGTGVWRRIEDVALKNRIERNRRRSIKVDNGLERLFS